MIKFTINEESLIGLHRLILTLFEVIYLIRKILALNHSKFTPKLQIIYTEAFNQAKSNSWVELHWSYGSSIALNQE